MKAIELMIFDWVLINNTPHKIQAIDSIDAEIQADDELYYVGEDRYHSEDKVEGVPLTAEILERNEFHTNNDHTLLGSHIYRRMYGKYYDYEVVVRMLNGWVKIKSYDDRVTDILTIDIQPRFVHQLQHALRLCGLNELADNFKV